MVSDVRQWRLDFFHGWLREHRNNARGRCVEKRCWVERAKHPCQMRERAVAELVRDGHIAEADAEVVTLGAACCELVPTQTE